MAFPTTSILDNFNRANQGPPPSASWGGDAFSGVASQLKVISNQLANGAGAFSSAYWSAATFGPDSEVYCTVNTLPANGNELAFFVARLTTPGATATAVALYTQAPNFWQFYKIVGGAQTALGASFTQAISAGDSIGFAIVGTQYQAWYKAAAGAWTQIQTLSDASVAGTGVIGLEMQTAVTMLDDFGGGTVVAASTSKPRVVGYYVG